MKNITKANKNWRINLLLVCSAVLFMGEAGDEAVVPTTSESTQEAQPTEQAVTQVNEQASEQAVEQQAEQPAEQAASQVVEQAAPVQAAPVHAAPAAPKMSDEEAELLRRDDILRASVSISDGSRIDVAEKGFSIVPPKGWEIHRDHPGSSLMMQIPYEGQKVYQRTIQVNAMNGGKAIDELTAKEFDESIVKNFTKTSGGLENFKIRNHVFVDLPTGYKGLLFYTEFLLVDRPMMQVHILVSSAEKHYLMSYTDVAENFEKGSESPFLNTAWESMTSIDVGSAAPSRFGGVTRLFSVAGLLVLLTVVFTGLRRVTASSQYKKMADDIIENNDGEPVTRQGSWHTSPKSTNMQSLHESEMDDEQSDWNVSKKQKNKAG